MLDSFKKVQAALLGRDPTLRCALFCWQHRILYHIKQFALFKTRMVAQQCRKFGIPIGMIKLRGGIQMAQLSVFLLKALAQIGAI